MANFPFTNFVLPAVNPNQNRTTILAIPQIIAIYEQIKTLEGFLRICSQEALSAEPYKYKADEALSRQKLTQLFELNDHYNQCVEQFWSSNNQKTIPSETSAYIVPLDRGNLAPLHTMAYRALENSKKSFNTLKTLHRNPQPHADVLNAIAKLQEHRVKLVQALEKCITCKVTWTKALMDVENGISPQIDRDFLVKRGNVQLDSRKVQMVQFTEAELQKIWPGIRISYRMCHDFSFKPSSEAMRLLGLQQFTTTKNQSITAPPIPPSMAVTSAGTTAARGQLVTSVQVAPPVQAEGEARAAVPSGSNFLFAALLVVVSGLTQAAGHEVLRRTRNELVDRPEAASAEPSKPINSLVNSVIKDVRAETGQDSDEGSSSAEE